MSAFTVAATRTQLSPIPGQFFAPSGFHRDPYIVGFCVGCANLFKETEFNGGSWKTSKTGEFMMEFSSIVFRSDREFSFSSFGTAITSPEDDRDFQLGLDYGEIFALSTVRKIDYKNKHPLNSLARARTQERIRVLNDVAAFVQDQPTDEKTAFVTIIIELTLTRFFREFYN
ncbi:MAG: hypothetical protein AAFQ36_07055 [Pseudomonadota bacterium]